MDKGLAVKTASADFLSALSMLLARKHSVMALTSMLQLCPADNDNRVQVRSMLKVGQSRARRCAPCSPTTTEFLTAGALDRFEHIRVNESENGR